MYCVLGLLRFVLGVGGVSSAYHEDTTRGVALTFPIMTLGLVAGIAETFEERARATRSTAPSFGLFS